MDSTTMDKSTEMINCKTKLCSTQYAMCFLCIRVVEIMDLLSMSNIRTKIQCNQLKNVNLVEFLFICSRFS